MWNWQTDPQADATSATRIRGAGCSRHPRRLGFALGPPGGDRGACRYLPRRRRQAACGLTLAETLIAMTIIGLALVPLMTMLPGASEAQLHAQRVMLCTVLAERKMEEARSALIVDFDTAAGGEGDFSADGHADYRYSVTVADVLGRPLKQVHVLAWHDQDNDGVAESHERQTVLDTLVARAMSDGP